MRKSIYILVLSILFLTLSSCKSRTQKMHEFVNGFNQTAAMSPTQSGSHAEVEGLDIIKLDLATALDINNPSSSSTTAFLEKSLPDMFQKDETMMELINEAVKFKVNITDLNGRIISTLMIDKTYLDKEHKSSYKSSTSNDPITMALDALNSNLPINNADGTRLMKIEKLGTDTLEYTMEVPDDVSQIINSPNAIPLVKESIIQDPSTKATVLRMRGLGINKVNYKLIDTKGKKLTTLEFKSSDF
ncbi:MAG: hypothetical protein RL607_871 [Bacteroidota bacterium]